jgi:hypothetical protein
LTWATLFFSSGTLVTVLTTDLPTRWLWLRPVLALIATALSVLSVVQQNAKVSTDCAELHHSWNQLATMCEQLWNDSHSDDAERRYRAVVEKTLEVSTRGVAIPYQEKRMKRWAAQVTKDHPVGG